LCNGWQSNLIPQRGRPSRARKKPGTVPGFFELSSGYSGNTTGV
jgi:hypothetical protein